MLILLRYAAAICDADSAAADVYAADFAMPYAKMPRHTPLMPMPLLRCRRDYWFAADVR